MRRRRRMVAMALAGAWVLLGATTAVRAGDVDGDGVSDAVDVCSNTPAGTEVDGQGRPLGDIDQDCDTELEDHSLFQQGFTGPLAPFVLMAPIPGGEFEMGDSFGEGDADELPVHDVHLGTYHIDVYQVTNRQYAAALNWAWTQGGLIALIDDVVYQAGSGTSYPYCVLDTYDGYSRIHWDGAAFTVSAGKEDHPMVKVSWYGAVAYCNWRGAVEGKPPCYELVTWTCDYTCPGYRLPTEAEWEKAAGWDADQERHFRFGEHTDGCGDACLDGQRANYWESGDPFEVGVHPQTTPVGFFNGELHYRADFGWPGSDTSYQTQDARSYYGCYDMSGGVWEWCHDWYAADYYGSSPYGSPTGPAAGTHRVVRGGVWNTTAAYCRSAKRHQGTPEDCSYDVGFRCVTGGM